MEARILRFRQWGVKFFPAGQLIRLDEPIRGFKEADDRLLVDHPRLRRFVIRLRPDWPLMCFCFHWSDGSDLSALDERVAAGTVDDADFSGAVVGEGLEMGHLACGASLEVVTLNRVVKLFSDDADRWRAHVFRRVCPVCGENVEAPILEVVDSSAQQDSSVAGQGLPFTRSILGNRER